MGIKHRMFLRFGWGIEAVDDNGGTWVNNAVDEVGVGVGVDPSVGVSGRVVADDEMGIAMLRGKFCCPQHGEVFGTQHGCEAITIESYPEHTWLQTSFAKPPHHSLALIRRGAASRYHGK